MGPWPQVSLIKMSKIGKMKRFLGFSVLKSESFTVSTRVLSPALTSGAF